MPQSNPRVDSHVDPWSHQGAEPVTPGQFQTSLPLEVLPSTPANRAEQLLGGAWSAAVIAGSVPPEAGVAAGPGTPRPCRPDPLRRRSGVRRGRKPGCGIPQAGRQPACTLRGLLAQVDQLPMGRSTTQWFSARST